MQKARSNSNPGGFADPRGVTVLWHGWLKKLGRFSKRWQRRYFVFLSTPSGMKELRHYDTLKDMQTLLQSTPKGVISMTDVSGICCFTRQIPAAKKTNMFSRTESSDSKPTAYDQKFAILTPLHVHFLAFHNGKEWGSSSESQQGLSLLASLSAFYSTADVLHSGWMSKRRERTVHSPKGIMSYWKRHYFVYLTSGDLLYFRDETLNELQGRVDVRHAPTVRVTGEHLLEEKKKDGIFKFSKVPSLEREDCLVWIATPPSKMFVLKVQEDHESGASGLSSSIGPGIVGVANTRKAELSPSAKKWLALLLKGHAQTKYTQLEKCAANGTFDLTPEIVSAVRAGIPDELRGQLWKGFSGAGELQRRAELKRAIKKVSKTATIRSRTAGKIRVTVASAGIASSAGALDNSLPETAFVEYSAPIDVSSVNTPENEMLFSRFCALALQDSGHVAVSTRPSELHNLETRLDRAISDLSSPSERGDRGSFMQDEDFSVTTSKDLELERALGGGGEIEKTSSGKRNSLKLLEKSKLGNYVYPSDYPAAEWEQSARRRVLLATSRYNPYSHPCPWRVTCLLLAYVEEESAFWILNSIMDRFLPGYFHGYRPALQVDAIAFGALLQDRSPALYSHLRSLDFALDRLVERWFLSLFTASLVPLPTVMRIWDAFFVQGVRIFYGIGLALLFRAEETLFHAKTAIEAEEYLRVTERSSIDADVLFAHVFKEDLNISWLTDEQLERWRTTYRQRLVASVSNKVEILSDKIGHLSGLRELCARCSVSAKYLLETSLAEPVLHKRSSVGSMLSDANDDDNFASGSVRADLAQSVKEVESHLKKLVDVITSLSSKYATKRSKWQAISSQLTACPLARLPNPDSYSWLTQVREGKISGAGYDSSYSPEEWEGFVSAERLMEVSDMVFDTGDATLVNADASGNGAASCLTSYRKDLQLTELHLSEVLIYALISAVKALSALRLELQAASFRAQLLCGHWIDAPIDFPMPERRKSPSVAGAAPFPGGPNSRQSTRITKAPAGVIANIGSGNVRRPRPMDDSALFERRSESSREARPFRRATSRSLYQSRLRPSISLGAGSIASPVLEEDPGLLLEEELLMSPTTSFGDDPDEDEGVIDPKVLAQIAQDGATGLTGWFVESAESMYAQEFSSCAEDPYLNEDALRRYQQGGKALADLHTRFVGSFSRFIRLESRARNWDVRERAVILEQDLQRELREVESEVAALQWQ